MPASPPQLTALSPPVPKQDRVFQLPLLIVFILVPGLAFILIWGLIHIMPGQQQSVRKPFCCPDILNIIQPLLNYSLNPCDDMYNFVCQTITEDSTWPGIPNIFYQTYSGILPIFDSVVYQRHNYDFRERESRPDAAAALGLIYRSCVKAMR
ncbi:unnamed protein product, partial [Ixodes hexagonus]